MSGRKGTDDSMTLQSQKFQIGGFRVEEVLQQADYLYESGETERLYQLLIQHKDSEDAELLWRLARASRDLAQLSGTSAEEKKALVYEALEYAKRALEKNEASFAAHKWCAICISDVGDYEGIKAKIANAYVIKEHFEKAIELNPKDATSIHLMGIWCYTFAEMPWYQRRIANMLFAAPPSSTYEEALGYFQKAEQALLRRWKRLLPPPPRDLGARGPMCSVLRALSAMLRLLLALGYFQKAEQVREPLLLTACSLLLSTAAEVEEAPATATAATLASLDPNFYSKNLLLLGKTYLKLQNKKLAAFWLLKAKDYPTRTEEDKQIQREAAQLLAEFSGKN
ncbi:Regulator of microtubule dynamics protein 1 [Myotis brandtii]|uniref:Regulator of microtubule dynamics protein 1 n=1 Tax=Myotis brandtii TaxID=109478 RepID=S7Q6L3_MYOBR|nr:Regulator of microtubule dynamics protein 1 [Myotis brandtii]